MTLRIKFVNDITFKYIHDLIMEYNPEDVFFIESYDDVDLNYMYKIAHLINTYNPELPLLYVSEFRKEYPLEELSAEYCFREIPFEAIYYAGQWHYKDDERI